MLEVNKIYNIHCLDGLKQLDDESIDCVVTSPPYWNLRDYNTEPIVWGGDKNCEHEWVDFVRKGQWRGGTLVPKLSRKGVNNFQEFPDIEQNYCSKCGAWKGSFGNEPEIALYVKHLCDIFDEVKRVLKKDGTCWIVIGDTYGTQSGAMAQGKWGKLKLDGKINKIKQPNINMDKCLCMIPQRFAIEMCNRSWILRNIIIWYKPNAMPSSMKDRFTVDFEYIYFFTKSKHYYFEQQFDKSIYSNDDRKSKGSATYEMRNKRTVWSINTQPLKEFHFATFPCELIEIPIRAGCYENGIVLDPFIGSGTTGIVAKNQNKNYIGFELNSEYVKMAKKRIKENIKEYDLKVTDFF